MKAIYFRTAGALAVSFTIAACIPSAEPPPPAPPPPPVVTPAPAPPPPPPPVVAQPAYENYLDAPQTPGTWRYIQEPGESLALFGASPDRPQLILRCAAGSRQVGIGRVIEGSATMARPMRIQTETTTRVLQAEPVESERTIMVAQLPADDPLLDAMAITKGRFALGLEDAPTLYVPAWVEVSRVIEDCR